MAQPANTSSHRPMASVLMVASATVALTVGACSSTTSDKSGPGGTNSSSRADPSGPEVIDAVCKAGTYQNQLTRPMLPNADAQSMCVSPSGYFLYFGGYSSSSILEHDMEYPSRKTYAYKGRFVVVILQANAGTGGQEALAPLEQYGFTIESSDGQAPASGSSASTDNSTTSSSCDRASCVPNVAHNVTPNGSCNPQRRYDFGLDFSGNTYVCLNVGSWSSAPPLTGIRALEAACPSGMQASAQSPEGIAMRCADGRWEPGDDIPR
ncbi:hypothetical protein [Mycolicibacterium sp. CBMA 226]|uniref:hypothetical protein n=1 Tax=Mycolicibacterium sp. CBMA 226 TaxID=2606611 RepID=UPI0012DCC5C5|nr:hypothetical protein [Mycolicibacterium sp. CBMA 226]MUL76444.1 hypothetical protein [Mycolicibacterium sp. CBMA 226]